MRPIIGRLTAETWVAHVALVVAAALAAAILASHAEGELARKMVTSILWALVLLMVLQHPVEAWQPGGRVSYGIPYVLCAMASIVMLEGQSMNSQPIVTATTTVSAVLFVCGIGLLAFQVRGLLRSA